MARQLIYYSILTLCLVGCKEQGGSTAASGSASCKGEWTEKDANGKRE